MERSEKILQGLGNQYYRATLKSMGFTTEDLKRPVIGIANAWSECVPGHYNLRQVAQRVKDGIYRAGGTPIEFGVIGGCDGMGQGHDGMHYILPSRELIANSIESMAQINLFDGLVLLGSCDKIVPGMLMAAARLDIPCIFLPGGPMEGGVEFDGRQADQTSSTEAYGMLSAGKITEAEYVALEDTACPGCGSCSYLGTANTMCALAEALGMTLPDGGLAPATSAVRMMMAEETGVKIMELVEKQITARKIITNGSIRNAIKACLAMSGSTNAVMHLTAIAHEAGLDIRVLDEFDTLSRTTPQIAKMNPACKYNVIDFYYDGGVPRLMENLQTMLETDAMTVTAHTLAENIASHKYRYPATGLVVRTMGGHATAFSLAGAPELTALSLAQAALADFRAFADAGGGVMLITHDIELALTVADRVAVFRDGTVVEETSVAAFASPDTLGHPFTRQLWHALPEHGFVVPTEGGPLC